MKKGKSLDSTKGRPPLVDEVEKIKLKEGVINFELDIRTDEFKKRALEGEQTSATKRNRASSSVTEISDKTIQRLH